MYLWADKRVWATFLSSTNGSCALLLSTPSLEHNCECCFGVLVAESVYFQIVACRCTARLVEGPAIAIGGPLRHLIQDLPQKERDWSLQEIYLLCTWWHRHRISVFLGDGTIFISCNAVLVSPSLWYRHCIFQGKVNNMIWCAARLAEKFLRNSGLPDENIQVLYDRYSYVLCQVDCYLNCWRFED